MKRFSEQVKKQSESIRLRASERAELRDRLVSYLEYHPLPIEMRQGRAKSTPATITGVVSEPFTVLPINWFWVRNFSAVFALFVMIVVPVAAERTTPGDVLYPVKVRFNEEVRSSLTLSPYEKIEWETTRLERRIAEARQLASEGKLTNDVEAQVAEAVKEHSEKAKSEIAALRATDSDEAAIAEISFASALAVQSEVLQKTVESTTIATNEDPVSTSKAGSVLATLIAHESDEADASQAAATPSYEKLLARVEAESTDAYELFESVKKQASNTQQADIERRLADIERKIAAAMAIVNGEEVSTLRASTTEVVEVAAVSATSTATSSLASSSEDMESGVVVEPVIADIIAPAPTEEEIAVRKADAVQTLREALTDLKKLMSFMTDLTVREALSIDSLVPVTLTDDERRAVIYESLQQVDTVLEHSASTTVGGEKAVKLAQALTDLEAEHDKVTHALDANDLASAEQHVAIAISLVRNIAAMSEAVPETTSEESTERGTSTVPEEITAAEEKVE